MARQIKRYDMYANHDNDVDEVEQADGEWVRYEDIALYINEVENAAALAPDSVTGESAIKQCLPICNACGKIMSLESIEMGIKGHRFICACGHKFNAVLVEQSLYDSVPSKKDGILPLEKGKCDDCFYWEQLETDLAGKCRRYPPVRFPGEDYDDYYFPCPQSNTWCGEFKRKVTAES